MLLFLILRIGRQRSAYFQSSKTLTHDFRTLGPLVNSPALVSPKAVVPERFPEHPLVTLRNHTSRWSLCRSYGVWFRSKCPHLSYPGRECNLDRGPVLERTGGTDQNQDCAILNRHSLAGISKLLCNTREVKKRCDSPRTPSAFLPPQVAQLSLLLLRHI